MKTGTKIEIKGCDVLGCSHGFLADLGRYYKIDKWLQAMADGKASAHAFNVSLKIGKTVFRMIRERNKTSGYEAGMKALLELPENFRWIPNDTLIIKYDIHKESICIDVRIDDDDNDDDDDDCDWDEFARDVGIPVGDDGEWYGYGED